MKVDVRTLDAGEAGSIELNETIFGLEPRADILFRVVNWQLANRRTYARAAKEPGTKDFVPDALDDAARGKAGD